MTFYLLAGSGASTTPAVSDDHLPSRRVRRHPSDTTNTEWQVLDVQAGARNEGGLVVMLTLPAVA